jgi:hypothetical protein
MCHPVLFLVCHAPAQHCNQWSLHFLMQHARLALECSLCWQLSATTKTVMLSLQVNVINTIKVQTLQTLQLEPLGCFIVFEIIFWFFLRCYEQRNQSLGLTCVFSVVYLWYYLSLSFILMKVIVIQYSVSNCFRASVLLINIMIICLMIILAYGHELIWETFLCKF